MRIIRLLKAAARVPGVWIKLQRVHHCLKHEGVQSTLKQDWNSGIHGWPQGYVLRIHRVAWIFSPWTTCLRRSILLCGDLKANGYSVALRQGIRKDSTGKVQMHAWVEVEGKVVGDRQAFVSTFQPIELPF